MTIPRIRGRPGIADEGEHKGKWFYEVSIWDLAGEHQGGPPFQFGPFDSEKQACDKGREIVRYISEHLEKKETGEISGKYLDLKNGAVLRPWENNS
jgi:hypothetical protein